MSADEGPLGGVGSRSVGFSEALHQSPTLVSILTPVRDDSGAIVELIYSFVNDAALQLYGMSAEDVVGHGLLELFPASRDNGVFDADVGAIRTQALVELDVPWAEANGVRGAFTMRVTPYADGVLVTAVEGTATMLAESERRYRLLAEAGSEVVYTHDMDGVIEWVSPSVTGVLGWSREDFMSVPPRDLIHPDDLTAMVPVRAAALARGAGSGLVEMRYATVDGGWRWMSVVAHAIRDDQGRVIGAVEALRDVQSEVEAREALVVQAERLELVLEGSGLGLWDRDMQTGGVVVDDHWAGILGYSLAGLQPVSADTWIDLTHPDDLDKVRKATEDHAAGLCASFDIEARMRHWDGRWVWVRNRGRIVEWSTDGRPLRMTGTLEDITGQREAREALERSAQALRATQQMARLGSWRWDIATDHVTWSEELFELFGLDPAQPAPDYAGQGRLYGAQSWAQVTVAVAETARTGVPYEMELETVRADSRRGWVHARGEAVRDEYGLIVGLRGYLLDITERKAAEQALASSESLFRTAMLSSPIGMALSELDGSFRVVNGSLCRMLGRDEAWLTAHTIQDVVHPDDLEQIAGERAEMFDGEPAARLATVRLMTSDNQVLWVKRAAELIGGEVGSPDYLLVQYVDTTAEHDALEALAYQAFHDPLTGLRNRAWILDMMEVDLRAAPRIGSRVAALFIDLDNFKIVNDSLGHAAGDEVLVTVAARIAGVLRPRDRVGRTGGDEFIVLVPDVTDSRQAERVAKRIVSAVGTELTIRGHRIVPTVSIGIALNTPNSTSATLLRDADAALFRAKAAGRSRWQFFDGAMHADALARLTIEDQIRQALDAAEFVVHYQPIVTMADRRVAGHEALVRWQHPTRGLLCPIDFLPTAEDSGLIVGIGQHVLDQVCALLATSPDLPGPISVNFSPVQLARAGWLQAFTDTLARHGVDPRRIIVELTETAIMSLLAGTRADLAALRDLGVGIHVDDFGTGFSSISLLRDLPVTGLKLDATFVADLSEDDAAANALSTGLAGLVNGLHLVGIAEGVESEDQHRILLREGWSQSQGYLYARPAPQPTR